MLSVEGVVATDPVEENGVRLIAETATRVTVAARPLPDDLVLEVHLAEELVEHHLDVVTGVPVAVIVKAARAFEDAGELLAARAHEFDVGLGGRVAIVERALLLGLSPEDFIVAVGIEGRVDVDQVDAAVRELGELVEVVAAVDDSGVQQRGRFARGAHRLRS